MSPPDDLDRLSQAELKGLVVKQWEQIVGLQRIMAALRDEIARLKGGPGRPNLKRSGMERGTEPPGSSSKQKRPRGSTRSKLAIDEERTVTVAAPPRGSRFKGYTSFVVQDLVIRQHVVNFRCERWQTPDGDMMTAPLPAGIDGHFGPQLRRFVLAQYHQGQMTVPRLVTLLRGLGRQIAERQRQPAKQYNFRTTRSQLSCKLHFSNFFEDTLKISVRRNAHGSIRIQEGEPLHQQG
jgi:hypothetical protein